MAVEYLAKIGFPKKIVEKKIEDEFGSELIGQIEKIYGKYHRKNELPRLKIKKKLLTGFLFSRYKDMSVFNLDFYTL